MGACTGLKAIEAASKHAEKKCTVETDTKSPLVEWRTSVHRPLQVGDA